MGGGGVDRGPTLTLHPVDGESMKTHRIVTIPGDGIGPEVVEAAVRVLRRAQEIDAGFTLEFEEHDGGAGCFARIGTALSADSIQACRDADAVLKGPVGLPSARLADGTEAGLLGGILRLGLDLYANVRPILLWPGVRSALAAAPGGIDYVIVRENTEGLYLSRGRGVGNDDVMADTLMVTRRGVERIAHFAFETALKRRGAPSDGRTRVTCVDKSNVLRSFGLFRRVFQEVGESYPAVEKDLLYADAAAQALVQTPQRFDVLVMENFLGDILSDLGGGTVGGIGMCPSGNIGENAAYFEPVHGSAPDIAGRDLANPCAQILSAAMLLDHVGETGAAGLIRRAVGAALSDGALVIGDAGRPTGGGRAAAEAVLDRLGP